MPHYILTATIFKFKMAAGYHVDSDGYPACKFSFPRWVLPLLILSANQRQECNHVPQCLLMICKASRSGETRAFVYIQNKFALCVSVFLLCTVLPYYYYYD